MFVKFVHDGVVDLQQHKTLPSRDGDPIWDILYTLLALRNTDHAMYDNNMHIIYDRDNTDGIYCL